MNEHDEVRFIGGLALTGALLAAGHWFPWWKRLERIYAYIYGVGSILAGQAIWLGFDETWRRVCAFAIVSWFVVDRAYGYDKQANDRAIAQASADGL